MQDLAVALRTYQLFVQSLHNTVRGLAFISHHEFLGELYEEVAGDYDDVVERCIGTGVAIDPFAVQHEAGMAASQIMVPADPAQMFITVNNLESLIRDQIAEVYPAVSIGTQQLIGEIANKSEKRSYKLQQLIP